MPEKPKAKDPSTGDLTHKMLNMTQSATIQDMSKNVMFATKRSKNPLATQPFRPEVPARFKCFANRKIDGVNTPCVILEYVNGLNGEVLQVPVPSEQAFNGQLRMINADECILTLCEKSRIDKGF